MHHRWMGSVAMDKVGNIDVGYSVSGSTMYPAIRYTGRQTTDPIGTLQSEVSVVEGNARSKSQPMGDYTRMSAILLTIARSGIPASTWRAAARSTGARRSHNSNFRRVRRH